ncbi:MAG TPA: serine hydrolase [Pyrinomonadaceae bacterium]|nr:serine hydrolase [Pyrinomonadaceae bacterium]
MKSLARVLLTIGLSLSPLPAAAQTPLGKDRKEDLIARLERLVPPLMAEADVPGLALALVRGGELVWHRGFGVRNSATKEPVGDGTLFEAASLSKPVFAYAVLKLADSGRLDLDAPLNKYLPGNYDVGEDARLAQVTARRVLSHTAGFPNWRPRGERALKIHFTPGERFSYSGEGFVYLAAAVERLTGEPLADFTRRTVFGPLGMKDSSFVWGDGFEGRKVFNHNAVGKPTGQNRPAKANAAASLHTTARDFGLFLAAVLKGKGLKRETARLFWTPQVRVGESTNATAAPPKRLSAEVAWGLGWGLQTTAEGVSIWHWGDNGNSKAYVVAYPKERRGVVYFANSANGLSIAREVVAEAAGGAQPALAWLNYEPYNSPARALLKQIVARGAAAALGEYRERRKGRAASELVGEAQMNRVGYNLLSLGRGSDAVEVFKLNVEDHPQSSNAYDSLGEAYMVAGDREQAIRNYRKSVELNPGNAHGVEMLRKLEEGKTQDAKGDGRE